MSYSRTASNTPTPIAPSTYAIGGGTAGPVATGMVAGVSHSINQIAAVAALLGISGGGGYGIISGLALSAATGLNVALAPGIALMDTPLELVSTGPFGIYQTLVPALYTCADNAVNFLWLTNTGAVVGGTSMSPPTGSRIYLGAVTTVSGSVTNIDFSGVVNVAGGQFARQTADIGPPTDSPPAGMNLLTQTTTGVYRWQGTYHARQTMPPNVQTITTTLTLNPLSPRQQFITASGGDQIVELPNPALLPPGDQFEISNVGASNNVIVKDYTGAITYQTLAGGLKLVAPAVLSGSTVTFPSAMAALGVGAVSGVLFKQAGAGTPVTGTAAETQLAGFTLPANTLEAGSVLRVSWQGNASSFHIADTVTIRVRFGSASLSGTILVGGAAIAGTGADVFTGTALLTCRAAPSSASAVVGTAVYIDPAQIISSPTPKQALMTSTNFATNATLVVEVTAQFSSNNGSNSCELDQFVVELL